MLRHVFESETVGILAAEHGGACRAGGKKSRVCINGAANVRVFNTL
jgi:hypothetical protein